MNAVNLIEWNVDEKDARLPDSSVSHGRGARIVALSVGPAGAPLLALQRGAGNRAVARLLHRAGRTAADIERDYEEVVREADELRRHADDLVEQSGLIDPTERPLGSRAVTDTETRRVLEELAGRRDGRARDLLEQLRELEQRQDDLFEEWLRARSRFQSPGGGKAGAAGKEATAKAAEKEAGNEGAGAAEETVVMEAGGTGRVPDEPTVAAERVGEDACPDLAEKAAGTAAEGLTFAETVGAAFEAISPLLDVLFLAQAGYAIGKALIFHNRRRWTPSS